MKSIKLCDGLRLEFQDGEYWLHLADGDNHHAMINIVNIQRSESLHEKNIRLWCEKKMEAE